MQAHEAEPGGERHLPRALHAVQLAVPLGAVGAAGRSRRCARRRPRSRRLPRRGAVAGGGDGCEQIVEPDGVRVIRDGGDLGREVDLRACDAVDLVEALLDAPDAAGARHPFDVQVGDDRLRLLAALDSPGLLGGGGHGCS
jgi:hypothetical protein